MPNCRWDRRKSVTPGTVRRARALPLASMMAHLLETAPCTLGYVKTPWALTP